MSKPLTREEADGLLLHGHPTEAERRNIEALLEYGSTRAAAAATGMSNSAYDGSVSRLRKRAALGGFAQGHWEAGTAPGYRMGKVTIQRANGVVERTWERQHVDSEVEAARAKAMREVMLADLPLIAATEPPVYSDDDLITVYPEGDGHAGLYSWVAETGHSFDLVEYERIHRAATDRLIASAPPSAYALYIDLGDSFHADNNASRTKSGHHLDTHGRHGEIARVVVRCKRYRVARLLEKHRHVTYRENPGNHNGITAVMLSDMMAVAYEDEPRVDVADSNNPYWFHGFGANLIGTTHGDGAKGKDLPLLMAVDAPELWASSQHGSRVWFVGHVHHKDVKDYPGVTVEYCRTLAAPDIWSHGAGYRSKRSMEAVTYHRVDGEVERHTCSLGRMDRTRFQ